MHTIKILTILAIALSIISCQSLQTSYLPKKSSEQSLLSDSSQTPLPPQIQDDTASGTIKNNAATKSHKNVNTAQQPKIENLPPGSVQNSNISTGQQVTSNTFQDFDQIAPGIATNKAGLVESTQAISQPETHLKPSQTTVPQSASIDEDALQRLRAGMKMKATLNKRISKQLAWYVKNPGYMERVMLRARPLLPYILDELERKNLPAEFALLPIVESAYQAFAYSHGRASGLWQIIPSTGKYLGLQQNWWYDGRRDFLASTNAATSYLKSLGEQFDNDWQLALAAYNAGPGTIRSAIRYNKRNNRPTDFWHLTKIRRETRDYVPKLMALKELFSHPEKYGFSPVEVKNEHVYTLINTKHQLDLALAAELAGLSIDEIYRLNPAINHWATAPDGPHELLIPTVNAKQFEKNLAHLPKHERVNWVRYKIKPGDTLSQISEQFRTQTQLIRKINKIRKNNIRAGKYLLIPTARQSLTSYTLSKNSRAKKIKNTLRKGIKTAHIVSAGDSLWRISRKYKVSINALAKWNSMARKDPLRIGQKLLVWRSASSSTVQVSLLPTQPKRPLRAMRYSVRKGDSLSRIADRFNIEIADIKKWNKIGKYLQPGQKIKLYIDVTRQSG